MSHVTKIKIEVKSLEALKKAASTCGLEFREGQKCYRWYGRFMGDYPSWAEGIDTNKLGQCDHALSVAGNDRAYEVGVVDNGNGSFSLLWDFWSGGYGLQAAVGNDGSKLIAEYSLEAAQEAAQSQGWYCEREADHITIYHPDGGTITVTADGAVDASLFTGHSCVAACAPIENALGSQGQRQLKGEYYQEKQMINLKGE